MVKSLNLFCNSLPSNIFPSYLHSRWCRISAVNMNWFTVRHITLFLLSSSTKCFQLDLFSWYVFAYIVETIETCIMMLCICFCFAFLSKASQHTHNLQPINATSFSFLLQVNAFIVQLCNVIEIRQLSPRWEVVGGKSLAARCRGGWSHWILRWIQIISDTKTVNLRWT